MSGLRDEGYSDWWMGNSGWVGGWGHRGCLQQNTERCTEQELIANKL